MKKNDNFASMDELWEQASARGVELMPGRVVVKGVIFQREDGKLLILSGQTEFYDPLPEEDIQVFLSDGVDAGVKNVLLKKYTQKKAQCERLILIEDSTRRNQKRIEFLKTQRDELEERIATI